MAEKWSIVEKCRANNHHNSGLSVLHRNKHKLHIHTKILNSRNAGYSRVSCLLLSVIVDVRSGGKQLQSWSPGVEPFRCLSRAPKIGRFAPGNIRFTHPDVEISTHFKRAMGARSHAKMTRFDTDWRLA
ncbi:hypothetical protein CEXT_75401 [Caerostris extrusa]|uniref:Uncharacterized protein n=1 Tax=Caerostris extrusa TaxID=172846 RepID=A0AAV4W2S1_CAEEX|nr:hypothetical protein CEXT_75401 [Caerostris extrusa]